MRRARRLRAKPGPAWRRRLVIMVKEPVGGRVKTRLARDIGGARAVAFARHSGAVVVARLSAGARWQTLLGVDPATAATSRAWPAHLPRIAQGGGDLGARMQRLLSLREPGPVVLVGADIPGIRPSHIAAAFAALGRNDAVFGPASDGGYWLVGLKRFPTILRPFARVRWSSRHAAADTLANLHGRKVAMLATLDDVDTGADLARVRGFAGRRVLPA